MLVVSKYFLYFIIYSFLGWTLEVGCKLVEKKKFVNRGFLIGPLCPIYGHGVLLIILLIGKNTEDVLSVFLKGILICSILEYLTSYLMEKVFETRWWDYSKKKYNINGRICLETMIPFGLLGLFIVYFLHPLVKSLVNKLNSTLIIALAIILFIIYLADNIISFIILNKIKLKIKNSKTDNTELIKEKVEEWLNHNSKLYRRVKEAYPKFEIIRKIRKK